MGRQLRVKKPPIRNISDLRDRCLNIWYNLSPVIYQGFVACIPRRVEAVLRAKDNIEVVMAYKFPFLIHSAKCSSENFPYITDRGIKDSLAKQTGRERVIAMYSTGEFGFSPEISYVIKTGQYTFIFAGFFGALASAVKANNDFFRRNVATTYESKHLARRSLADTMSLAAIRGGLKTGLQYSAFSTLYLLSVMTIANYRNKLTVWEHVGSAAILGGFSRLNYGFRGMLVAGGLGGVLGLIAGGVITLALQTSGVTLEDLRCFQHEEYYTKRIQKKPPEDTA
ncbi:uncharacterized protein NPIL_297011 [Nephila pilipes]|uniref:Complex I assembly factor TIMMDC1, mitochondrial n=1 Tax=Nephila pilipes TaxID=299642 RepID=A0A8X6PQS4_NEPPI|nr:uncharacterized protein NPIL_297011 [Nephila pilipes]